MREWVILEVTPIHQVIELCVREGLVVSIPPNYPFHHWDKKTEDWLLEWIDAEALQVTYDPSKITYRQLIEFLYKMHDPTTSNRQGPDSGSQYRSGIFYHNAEQEKIAKEVTKQANEKWWKNKIVTEILPAGEWYDAEDYHQKYLVSYRSWSSGWE